MAPGETANAFEIQQNLEAAFEAPGSKGVMLEINRLAAACPIGVCVSSNFGSQSTISGQTSACRDWRYWCQRCLLHCSCSRYDHAAPASIVGSIGVVSSGFGFNDLLEKLGIDRRIVTAGENKAMLDPFLPESETDKRHLQGLLNATHQQFIARVQEGRGERLTGDQDVFDGRVWSGEQALILGLVDSLAGPLEVAREWIGAEDRVYYVQDEPLLNQFSREFGFGVGAALMWIGRQGISNPWSLSH